MKPGYRTIALIVSTAVFMQFLDATALNTALPAMGRDLNVPAVSLNITILAYQLALAAFIPVGNIAADRMGAKNAFALSLLVFLIGSLCCALSNTLPALVISRAFQGLGGAVMMPVSRQIVVRSAAKHELVSAMNWLLIPGIVGPLVGPVLGGLMVTYLSWHWIFLINIPVALIGIVLTLTMVPDNGERAFGKIDVRGVILIAAAVICLVFGLEGVTRQDAPLQSVALVALGLLLAFAYTRHAAGHPSPALDLSLLAIAPFRYSMISGSILRAVAGASGLILPLWFQLAMGMTALQAGTLITASILGALLCRFFGGPLMRIIHPRTITIGGVAFTVVMLLVTALLRPDMPQSVFLGVMFAQGLATSVPLIMISAVAYVDVPPERLATATGLYTTIQQLMMPVGVTIGVLAISAMRGLAQSGDGDGITYSGAIALLAGLSAFALYATGRISRESLGSLSRHAKG